MCDAGFGIYTPVQQMWLLLHSLHNMSSTRFSLYSIDKFLIGLSRKCVKVSGKSWLKKCSSTLHILGEWSDCSHCNFTLQLPKLVAVKGGTAVQSDPPPPKDVKLNLIGGAVVTKESYISIKKSTAE